jgi:X-Pro dipeptidyl-peptidase
VVVSTPPRPGLIGRSRASTGVQRCQKLPNLTNRFPVGHWYVSAMRTRARRLGAILGVAGLLALPAAAPGAEVTYETIQVPTVDGAQLHVEIARPATGRVPVILTYSPYNSLSESTQPNLANDDIGQRYVPKGYARAVADVLGTRNSSGCWDYGGLKEQQSGVDLVNALAREPWSNGRVAMIGGSYDGTTANMVAARGADASGLAAIVPESAINHWYGYAYGDGIRYAGNSDNPTDEGIDTPAAFDFGITRTPPTQNDPQAADALSGRLHPCDAADHTAHGYDSTPDYDAFWLQRDYAKDAARFRVPVLIVHGWQDYNVKQSEGTDLYDDLPVDDPHTPQAEGVPFKLLYLFQGTHQAPTGKGFLPLLDAFFAHTLQGADNGVEAQPPVITQGRTAEQNLDFRPEAAWPPPGTRAVRLELGRGPDGGTLSERAGGPASASYQDSGNGSEERARQAPTQEGDFLFYQSPPLTAGVRLAGRARLDAVLAVDQDHGHLTPVLVDVAPDGTATTIARGFLNLLYRNGLASQAPVPPGGRISVRVRFSPQDQTVEKGHRIGVLVMSSNVAWAVADQPAGGTFTIFDPVGSAAGSRLSLPVVGPPTANGQAGLPFGAGGGPGARGRRGRRARRLTVRIARARHTRRGRRVVVVSGRAPAGARVRVRLLRARRVIARRTVAARRGRYRAVFLVRRTARLRARVDARAGPSRLRAISTPLRARSGAR